LRLFLLNIFDPFQAFNALIGPAEGRSSAGLRARLTWAGSVHYQILFKFFIFNFYYLLQYY